MEEGRGKQVAPAIDQLAFTCPHCHALARQFWFSMHADPLKADEKPVVATAETGLARGAGRPREGKSDTRRFAPRRSHDPSAGDRKAMQRAWRLRAGIKI